MIEQPGERSPPSQNASASHATPPDVRLRVLLDLSDPARGGRANVTLLAARTGIDPKKLSPHLGKLKDLGLIFSQREGKEIGTNPPPTASATSGRPTATSPSPSRDGPATWR